jgi:Bacterial Ig-like domain (group 2)
MSLLKSKLRLICAFAALATLVLAASCRGFFVKPTLSSITVDPPTPTVSVAANQQMFATGTFNDNSTQTLSSGTSCSNNTVCWSESTGGSVITITSGGLVTGIATGTSTVTAVSGAITGTTTVTVSLSNVSALTLDSTTYTIAAPNDTASAKALATTPNGKVDVSATATWTTGNNSTATVQGGTDPVIITGVATGNTTVTATYVSNGVTYTATSNVTVGP